MKRLVLSLSVLVLSGCTMGPNYQRPKVALPGEFRGSPAPGGATAASIADTKWQDLFPDQTLNQMVTTALTHNFDLQIAAERVEEARAQLGITRANQFPSLDGQVGFTAARSSSVGANTLLPNNYTL